MSEICAAHAQPGEGRAGQHYQDWGQAPLPGGGKQPGQGRDYLPVYTV